MATIISAVPDLIKHSGDQAQYVMAFGQALGSRTISTVDSIAATSGMSVSAEEVNGAALTDDSTGETIPASTAVAYTGSGGTDGTDYTVTVTCTLSDGSTMVGVQKFKVRDS